jgi:hypothetical protein
MSHLRRMSDNGRMGILVGAMLALGSLLCWVGGLAVNWLLGLGLTPISQPLWSSLVVIAALALSCWACLALVKRMFGRTYG